MNIQVEGKEPERLDLFLTKQLPELSRSRIQALVKTGAILLNQKTTKPKATVSAGDIVSVTIPEEVPDQVLPEDIPLDVLYEDDDLIVLNKAPGMVVHPAAGNREGTLVNALLHHCDGQLAEVEGNERPGIIHRLDKDTSGCIVVAKTTHALQHIVQQFKDRSTEKEYLTVVQGCPPRETDSVFTNIGRHPVNRLKMAVVNPGSGKEALTDYIVLQHLAEQDSTLVHCILHTGRTHQIRVHMHHIGCPIIGDVIYAKLNRQQAQPGRLMLHARRLCITHPVSGKRLNFIAPLPQAFSPWTAHSDAPILNDA